MKTLSLSCRYQRVVTDSDVPCTEENLSCEERVLPIPAARAALVLVDVWNIDFLEGYFARVERIVKEKIAPLLEAARAIGVTVIHAPSPEVAARYTPAPPAEPIERDTWPPADFLPDADTGCRNGEYAVLGRDHEPRLSEALSLFERELDIHPLVAPTTGEPVIHNGPQLHHELKQRGILHLFYAGFASNWCIQNRDYGVVEMNKRGYNVVFIRDATTGIEVGETAQQLALTAASIREIETKYAWSTTTGEFCNAAI